MDVPALLGVPPDEADALLEHFERDTFQGTTYRRLSDARRGVERGTVIFDDTIVRGFPSIPRVLVLETGVPTYFSGPLAVEEKFNGYNVRIVDVGEPVAFTRGGIACPFSTPSARALLDLEPFFADHPEKMLCTEFVGPENPYTPHEYPDIDSLDVRVFDVRDRQTGRPLPIQERRDLLAEYDFPQPDRFATLEPESAPSAIREIVDDLDDRGREGVVMQSADGRDLLKYTTGTQHADDLAFAFSLPFDYGRDFSFSRLIREGFQAVEWDESAAELEERAHRLGEALLYPMVETIREVEAGELVGERHVIRGSAETVEATLEHIRAQGIRLEIEADRTVDDQRVVEFVKVTDKTRDSIEYYLEGGTIDE
ncbi:MAG: RNA ligase [Halobacteriota archaeon]